MDIGRQLHVIVSCAGKFHAFALVEQLLEHGFEVTFYTPYASQKTPWLVPFVGRVDREKISPKSLRTNFFLALLIRVMRHKPQKANDWFDAWVSSCLRSINADIFIGWSGMSLQSISTAKSKGMVTVVERSSAHILTQNQILTKAYLEVLGLSYGIAPSTIRKEIAEYNLADFISVPSDFVRNTFTAWGFKPSRIWVNHLGAPANFRFIPKAESNELRLLYVGQLSIQKGVDMLLDVVTNLLKHRAKLTLSLAGGMDRDFKKLISRRYQEHPKIQFMGFVPNHRLPEIMAWYDLLVVPSRQDGFAMVVPQALQAGLPVLVSNKAGASELVQEGINGWVMEPTIEAIHVRLNHCLGNPNELRFLRQNLSQRSRFKDVYSWSRYGYRYAERIRAQFFPL